MASEQQRKWGGLPINKRVPQNVKVTEAELETGMTAEQLRDQQQQMRAAALKRFLGEHRG